MPKLATREKKLGSVLKYEFGAEYGYCREVVSVTLTPTSELGDVVDENGLLWEAANSPTAAKLIVDPEVYSKRPDSGTAVVDLAVLVEGPAIIAKEGLNFVETGPADVDAVLTALKAVGIKNRTRI